MNKKILHRLCKIVWTRGYVYLENRQEPGWSRDLPIYLFKCKEHGWQESKNAGRKDKMKLYCEGCKANHRFGYI